MLFGPLLDEGQSSGRQISFNDFESVDRNLCAILCVAYMEMSRDMVVPEHLNKNTIEDAECRHFLGLDHAAIEWRGAPSCRDLFLQ